MFMHSWRSSHVLSACPLSLHCLYQYRLEDCQFPGKMVNEVEELPLKGIKSKEKMKRKKKTQVDICVKQSSKTAHCNPWVLHSVNCVTSLALMLASLHLASHRDNTMQWTECLYPDAVQWVCGSVLPADCSLAEVNCHFQSPCSNTLRASIIQYIARSWIFTAIVLRDLNPVSTN